MKALAVIPARMGSTRVPRKNALEIEPGLSLAQHAVDCASDSTMFCRIVVSTDDPDALPIRGAEVSRRPDELSGPTADIAAAVHWELARAEASGERFDFVATLQPAVLARSARIVHDLVQAVAASGAAGGLTMARSHPWIWRGDGDTARARWIPGPYPRSQDAGPHWIEINAVQVASAEAVRAGRRWDAPLMIAELPPWVQTLDIDTQADLDEARNLWPWARTRLAALHPAIHGPFRIAPET